ncbi:DNA topoisomerase IB [Demequina sp. TTPB684]|uniref:DNA topoisomerase IB n=1 Tax=unclassified Demequina TaxID=2620311 RepID=UPI001CF12D9F|nr:MULTISPECIES: DNA topoisomerase IB [unclassified Demequina]MCB2411653.1 DNA topoisomerase IB [Demequina sp. TTPB684]UPU88047.1 DNA topoisomerase IB [Demequina sp. TMPB413]
MPRLRTSRPSEPGIRRLRRGRGFRYVHASGEPVSGEDRERIEQLVIPPAWQDVWICPSPTGHLQAVGTDAAGRRQYLYHPRWRERQERTKRQHILDIAKALPAAREHVQQDLERGDFSRAHALAVAFRLLDLGLFRVGGEAYAAANGSYGLATLLKDHVTVSADGLVFDYVAKSGIRRHVVLNDPQCEAALATMKRRRSGGNELLAWRDEAPPATWHDITSADINAYLHDVLGQEASAKDFRTWHGTVLAARALGDAPPADHVSPSARKRIVAAAMREVAEALGNTPAVARASYVDPRVIDLWHDGVSLAPVVDALGEASAPGAPPGARPAQAQEALEQAVLALLTQEPEAAARRVRRLAGTTSSRGKRGRAAA